MSKPVDVLLVEDDPAHAEIVRRNFKGFRIANRLTHVSDGQAALDYLQRQGSWRDADHPLPDLILLDLRLPRVGGLAVMRIIKSIPQLSRIPVVILTTSANDQDIATAYGLGANSYLVKPVGFNAYCEMLTTLGDFWLSWNCYPC